MDDIDEVDQVALLGSIKTGEEGDTDTTEYQDANVGAPYVGVGYIQVRRKNGVLEVLLQKRSDEKDSFPGCYDISSAGHIPAGQGFVDSALRELKEELGVTAQPQDLILCGQRSFQFSAVFHGKPFKDNQVSNVYLLWLDRDAEEFTLQKEEISAVRWMPLADCLRNVENGALNSCIFPEELRMVQATVEKADKT